MPEITKNELKHIRLLRQKKYRQQYEQFVVEGEKNIEELLRSNYSISAIYATSDWESSISEIETITITNKQLSQISNLNSPDKVLAVAKIPSVEFPSHFGSKITLCLDSINDPGNLGTIIRTADWFGIKNIICSPNTVDCFNPKTVMATKGSLFKTTIFYTELDELFKNHPSTIFGAYLDGEEISTKFEAPKECFLLMGSESHGISETLEPFVTNKIKIPKKGNAESLNVAMATSILLYQFTTK